MIAIIVTIAIVLYVTIIVIVIVIVILVILVVVIAIIVTIAIVIYVTIIVIVIVVIPPFLLLHQVPAVHRNHLARRPGAEETRRRVVVQTRRAVNGARNSFEAARSVFSF